MTTQNGTHPEPSFLQRMKHYLFDEPLASAVPSAPAPAPVDAPPVAPRSRVRALRSDSIAARLKTTRTARGLTQEAAAAQLGTSRSRYQQWEHGLTRPGEGQRARIAAWLATDPPPPADSAAPLAPFDLRAARKARGWTVKDVAARLHCSHAAIESLEGGKHPASRLRPALIALYSDEPDAAIRARVKADLLPAAPAAPTPDKAALIAPLSADALAEPGTQAIDRILPAWEAARGWTHRDVQRASGKCSEADLIRFANGTKRANGIVLRHLAQDVFGVPLATFLAGPDAAAGAVASEPPPPPEPTDQLVIVYGNAPPVVVACTARDYATLVALVTERAPAREGRR